MIHPLQTVQFFAFWHYTHVSLKSGIMEDRYLKSLVPNVLVLTVHKIITVNDVVVIWVNCPQVLAQVETNDSWMIIDFMSKRGAVVNFGPTAAPPSDWMTSKDECDVVVAFTKALAIFKVSVITVPKF
jgi:hypothetical protein